MSHTADCRIYDDEPCDCYVEPEPSQWELYDCELSGDTLDWRDRANWRWFEARPDLWFFKRYYHAVDKIHELSLRASPMMTAIRKRERELEAVKSSGCSYEIRPLAYALSALNPGWPGYCLTDS